MRSLPVLCTLALLSLPAQGQDYADLKSAPHHYWQTKPQDRFTKLMDDVAQGKVRLDAEDDLGSLTVLLEALKIPVSSQTLVYSATSLQSGLIAPDNPRAIYFNDDTYVGYVPGGRFEITSIDPHLGAIFYILPAPKTGRPVVPDRSQRCMNCHSGDRMNFVPGIALESVIASMTGGTLDGFRRGQFGHTIPFEDRLGGWYVTGEGSITKHHGNVVGDLSPKGLKIERHEPGTLYSWSRYPVHTSDMLPHLLHEHQAGFTNLVVEGTYRARHALHVSGGTLTVEQEKMLDQHADKVVRYVLFADEAPITGDGIPGEEKYRQEFLRDRPVSDRGLSLKDLDLKTRLFKYRCSYMIYTPFWDHMPDVLKNRVYQKMSVALTSDGPQEYEYLPASEKMIITEILQQTKPDWNRLVVADKQPSPSADVASP